MFSNSQEYNSPRFRLCDEWCAFGIAILLYIYIDKGVQVAHRPTKRSPSRHLRCGLVRKECWKKSNISIKHDKYLACQSLFAMLSDMDTCDISSNMNHDLSTDPNLNYDILHDHITKRKEKHLPFKFEKFNKHKHNNNKWISFGIIRSIKTRDAMYLKFKRCKQHSIEYHTLKNNLHVFNCILTKAIREAKIQYHDNLFCQYKNDSKKTWQTISNIICKSNTKRKTLDKIMLDSKVIKDKEEICNKFNDFFVNIGPKLATQIKPVSNKTYDTFLKRRVLMSFSFTLVNENDVLKHLASLRTKNSAGVDGISVKLLKKLSPALINPLSLLINQSLVTGVFPKKLKIAKVLPLFKKDDYAIMDNYRPISLLTSISKLFEKVVFTQLYAYFRNNNLFYDS